MKIKRITELALLTAASLIVFIIEARLPNLTPIQGVKLGLANIFTVYGVYRFSGREVALMVILGGIFGGNLSAIIYSLSGAVACLIGMLLMKKIIPKNYIWLCSVFGAVFHNMGQTAAAIAITGSFSVIAYAPVLIVSGCIAGAFTGLTAAFVTNRLEKS